MVIRRNRLQRRSPHKGPTEGVLNTSSKGLGLGVPELLGPQQSRYSNAGIYPKRCARVRIQKPATPTCMATREPQGRASLQATKKMRYLFLPSGFCPNSLKPTTEAFNRRTALQGRVPLQLASMCHVCTAWQCTRTWADTVGREGLTTFSCPQTQGHTRSHLLMQMMLWASLSMQVLGAALSLRRRYPGTQSTRDHGWTLNARVVESILHHIPHRVMGPQMTNRMMMRAPPSGLPGVEELLHQFRSQRDRLPN